MFSNGVRAALPVVLGYLGIGFTAGVVERAAIAVLSALLSIELLSAGKAGLLAIAAAFVVAFLTRSLLGTALAGVAVYWLLG